MHLHHDPDEYEVITHSTPCSVCGGDRMRCNGACNGSFGIEHRRRPAAEVARIKAERRRAEEDTILARADEIRRRRAAEPTS